MKKNALTIILAIVAVISIVFSCVFGVQKNNLNKQLEEANIKTTELTTKVDEYASAEAKAAEEAAQAKAEEEAAQAKAEEEAAQAKAAEEAAQAKIDEIVASTRIVCLAPDMVETVYALGLGDCIVGWSAYTDYPPEVEERDGWHSYLYYYDKYSSAEFDVQEELSHDVATVSKFYDCNEEIIAALNPTIILGSEFAQMALVDDLKAKGYNAYCFAPTSLDEVYTNMITIGELLGVKEKAEELVAGYYAEIEEIKAITSTLEPVDVYFEIAHRTDMGEWGAYGPYTMAKGTPFEEMLEIAGGKNIFGDLEGDYIEVAVTEEGANPFQQIIDRDPAVILSPYWPDAQDEEVTTIYEIMTRPGFDQVRAVKTGRVLYYDSSLMKRFGPRSITAIKKMAYLLHPYYFQNPENSVSPWELGKIDVDEKPVKSLY